jgi:hypothetical protein
LLLNDEKLLAKLGGGDLFALEARYHAKCLAMLYRNAEYAKRDNMPESEMPDRQDGIALAQLVHRLLEAARL